MPGKQISFFENLWCQVIECLHEPPSINSFSQIHTFPSEAFAGGISVRRKKETALYSFWQALFSLALEQKNSNTLVKFTWGGREGAREEVSFIGPRAQDKMARESRK